MRPAAARKDALEPALGLPELRAYASMLHICDLWPMPLSPGRECEGCVATWQAHLDSCAEWEERKAARRTKRREWAKDAPYVLCVFAWMAWFWWETRSFWLGCLQLWLGR